MTKTGSNQARLRRHASCVLFTDSNFAATCSAMVTTDQYSNAPLNTRKRMSGSYSGRSLTPRRLRKLSASTSLRWRHIESSPQLTGLLPSKYQKQSPELVEVLTIESKVYLRYPDLCSPIHIANKIFQ